MQLDLIQIYLQNIWHYVTNQLIPAITILILGGLLVRLAARLLKGVLKKQGVKRQALSMLAVSTTRAVIWIFIAAGALQVLGLSDIALALGGALSLSVLGIITALSGNLSDISAGIFLALDPDFLIGSTVETNKITGVIEMIDLRKTRIRDEEGILHVVPNRSVESAPWQVLKESPLAEEQHKNLGALGARLDRRVSKSIIQKFKKSQQKPAAKI